MSEVKPFEDHSPPKNLRYTPVKEFENVIKNTF